MDYEMYDGYIQQATQRIQAGEYDESIEILCNAIQVAPLAVEAYKMRGFVHAIRGDKAEAIEDFSSAIERTAFGSEPDNVKCELLGLRAELYGRTGHLDLARVDLDEAIELDPTQGSLFAERGRVLMFQEEFEAAHADLCRAIELDPNHGPAHCNRGMVRTRLNDNERAFADFERALECDPNDTSAMLNRGLMHLTRDNREAALRDFRKAREINPALGPNVERIYRDFNLTDDAPNSDRSSGVTAPGNTSASASRASAVYSRFYISGGSIGFVEEIKREDLTEKGLKSVSGLLIGLRAGAASVIRAVIQTGDTQHVQFGIPAEVFDEPVPQLNAFTSMHPEHIFSVTTGDQARSLNLVIPQNAGDEYRSMALLMFVISIGNQVPDKEMFNRVDRIVREIYASRPAVVTVLQDQPKNEAALSDLVRFTEHFAASLLLEPLEPVFLDDDVSPATSGAGDPEIPFAKVTLETLVELNVRSCEILTGRAGGSRVQAQAFDDWLESYRGSDGDLMEAILGPGRKLEANLGIMGKVFWTEVADGPYRFTSAYNTTSCYFIPRNAAPVPNIVDYQPRV